jgi:MFS family permease
MSDETNSTSLLRTKRYGAFWCGSLLSNIGSWMQSVAEPWLVITASGSSFLLGLDAFAINAPFWILTLLGGALADRADKGKVIFLFQGIQMLCPALIFALLAAGWINVWIIIALSLIVGITDALSMPAFSSLIPSIVSKKEQRQAIALNSAQFNLSRVLGPAIAGVVMVRYGALWCFGANAASYVPFFATIYWVLPWSKMARERKKIAAPTTPPIQIIRQILRDGSIRWHLISVLVTSLFCGPIITFTPVVVRSVFHGGAGDFGTLMAAFGVGGLAGPVFIMVTAKTLKSRWLSLISPLFFGLFVMAVPLIANAHQFMLVLVACGFLMTVANTSANTFLQVSIDDANRGQMTSIYMLAMRGGLSIGNLFCGVLTGAIGIGTTFLLIGGIAVALQGFILAECLRIDPIGPVQA